MVFSIRLPSSGAPVVLAAVVVVTTAYVAFGSPFSNITRRRKTGNQQLTKKSKKNCIRGLYNEGSTCFLNTTLQALAACPAFAKWVLHVNTVNNSNCPTIRALTNIISSINCQDNCGSNEGNTCSTRSLVNVLEAKGWRLLTQEEDAHEFLNILSTSVAEEAAKSKSLCGLALVSVDGKEDLSTKSPFHGYLASQLCCWTCGHKMPVHYDAFECLSIPLPNVTNFQNVFNSFTVDELLERFFQPETLVDVDCISCRGATREKPLKRAFLRKPYLAKLPKCLCIHIQRSQWLNTGQLLKRYDSVVFDTALSAGRFFSDGKASASKCAYQLCAAVVHMGTANSGHFVTYRRGAEPFSHVWYYTSDAEVRVANLDEVRNSCPYMLFYERI